MTTPIITAKQTGVGYLGVYTDAAGNQYRRASSADNYDKDAQFYIARRNNEPRHAKWTHEIYPIPAHVAFDRRFGTNSFKWFGNGRFVVYMYKKAKVS